MPAMGSAITPEESTRLARALAFEIGATTEGGTAGLLHELVRRPGAQSHRAILLAHETGWQELIWRALQGADLAEDVDAVTESSPPGS